MTAKTSYTNELLGEYRIVPDFLPPPTNSRFAMRV
jgi:hypothetical protein